MKQSPKLLEARSVRAVCRHVARRPKLTREESVIYVRTVYCNYIGL